MASDIEKLIVSLEARTKAFESALNKANRTAQTQLKKIEGQFATTNKKLNLNIGGLSAGAGSLGAAFGANQIKQYADAWTEAGNKIAATSAATGMQARSLADLNKLANQSRSGFTETVDLYAKLLRSTQGVAKSEEEVANATDIVNKAFKAGGAAASEQAAGILQLSQALSSGKLQGDELRSIRENAPLLAKAIADEFQTTIGGLKALGAAGDLTSERVFKAILKAGPQIEKQYGTTTATIADGFTRLSNASIEFVGRLNDITGAGASVGKTLSELAGILDNFGTALAYVANTPGVKFIKFFNDIIDKYEPLHKALTLLSDPAIGEAIGKLGQRDIGVEFSGATKQVLALFDAYRAGLAALNPAKLKPFDALRQKIADGTIGAKDAKAAIADIVGDDSRLSAMAKAFDPLLEKLQAITDEAIKAASAVMGLNTDDRAASRADQADTKKYVDFIDTRSADAKRADMEKQIDDRTAAILKAADDVGVSLTEAAARIQAQSEIASETTAKANDASASSAMDLIKKFEGYISTAKFDVNAYRVGYGSDTVTLSDGSIQKVTQGMTTTLAQANAELARRIQEFQSGIEGKIGADTFRGMSEQQQAALTSIAYNYGSLPDRIVEAIKTGNTETVFNAIKGLGSDNGGINQTRRSQEADLYLNGSSSIDQADIKLREDQAKAIRDTIAALAEETANIGFETSAMGMSNAERERATLIRNTLNELEKQGITITDEVRAAVEAEANARYGQVAAYDAAAQSAEQLKQAQEDLLALQEDIGGAFQDSLKGFISDLAHGKSLTEALSNAVSKLADRLLDIALDAAFKAIFGGVGGGGGIFGGLLGSLFGFASGGYTGDGGVGEPAGVVHGKEFVVNARATAKNRGLLEAMNAGAPGYASGGYVGRMAPNRGVSAQPAAPQVNTSTKVINTFDAGSFLSEALSSTEGERILLNFVKARPGAFRSAMGN